MPRTLFDNPYSTVVTDRNGELLGARIADDGQWRFPAIDTLPSKYKTCLIEFEDRHFYYHWGFNPVAFIRALGQNIKNKHVVSGGSTITMQVIRMSRSNDRTVVEKIIETILATRLEFRYSKEEILAIYASHAPFGGNVVGLEAASWRYFGRPSDRLSWAESAMLAVLPNSPSMIHLAKNREALKNKRDRLLKRLLDAGKITESQYEMALEEKLPDEPIPLPSSAPHLVSRFYVQDKGKRVVSTIDKNIQLQTENVLERWNKEFVKSDIQNMAAIVIDVQTNDVLAYCGNVRFYDEKHGNQVDVITAKRSPGSVLKPFLLYAMLEEGEILPNTLIPDIPTNINGFLPQNFNRQFDGAVPASEAVARSLNVPLVRMLREYNVARFYDFLRSYEIIDFSRRASDYGLSLILGGAEATLWDVSNSYSNMARSLHSLRSTDCSLVLGDENSVRKRNYNPAVAWQVFNAIKGMNRPEEIDWQTIPSMQTISWKTGTSYGFRDAWAVGTTPRFVVGVWVGNASGEGKADLTGAKTAGPVLFDIFETLPASEWFPQPVDELIPLEICRQSGHLKGRFCNDTYTDLVYPAGEKTSACPYHIRVHLTADEKYRVYKDCAEDEATVLKSWFVLPPAWAWYYKQRHPNYKSLPAFKSGCGENTHAVMQFIYPHSNNALIYLPKQLDGTKGFVTLQLAHTDRNATVFWHLNDEYMGTTRDFHQLSISPEVGMYSITVVDDEGNSLSCSIEIE